LLDVFWLVNNSPLAEAAMAIIRMATAIVAIFFLLCATIFVVG
jgi:hypothetical protein